MPIILDLLQKYSDVFNIRVSTLLFFSEELERDNKSKIKSTINKKMIKLLQTIEKMGGLNNSKN